MSRLWILGIFVAVLVVALTKSSSTKEGENEKEIESFPNDEMSCNAESCPAITRPSTEFMYKSNVEDNLGTGNEDGSIRAGDDEGTQLNQGQGAGNDGSNIDGSNDDNGNNDGGNDGGSDDNGSNNDGGFDDGSNDDGGNDDGGNDDGGNDDGGNDDGGNGDGGNDNGGNDDGGSDDGGSDDGGNDDGSNDDGGNSKTRGGRRRRNRGNAGDDDNDNVFSWEQDVGDDEAVTKSAEISIDGDIITIKSKDDDLGDLGFVQSVTTYDYSTGTSVVAIQPKGRNPCFLTEDTLTYTELLKGVIELRDSVANRSEEITLDGTGTPLSREDENIMFNSHPGLKQTCGRGNVVVLAEVGDLPPYDGQTKEIKVLTYDAELTILAPASRRAAAANILPRIIQRITNNNNNEQRRAQQRYEKFTWQQGLRSGRLAEKSALVWRNAKIVTLESQDVKLNDFGYDASTTTYDFTTGAGVAVMRPQYRGPCFLTDEALSYREMVEGVALLNGTLAAPSARVTLDGTGPPLSRVERQELFRTNSALRAACAFRAIVAAVAPGTLTVYNGTTVELKILTFDGEITIMSRSRTTG